MTILRVARFFVSCLFVSFILIGCAGNAPVSRLDELTGDWRENGGDHILRITEEGTYAIDHSGRLENDPLDSGTVTFDGKTLVFTSGEESRKCEAGDLWTWDVEILDEDHWTANVTQDDCESGKTEGLEWSWVACIGESFGAFLFECEPID